MAGCITVSVTMQLDNHWPKNVSNDGL